MLDGGNYCWHPARGDKREFSGKRRWIVRIEGANKSQRGLVTAILEERGGGRKEIREILEGGYALGQHTKTETGAAAEGQSAELAAASSSEKKVGELQGKQSGASHWGTARILHLPSKMLYLSVGQVRPLPVRWKICLLSCAWFGNIN